MSGEEHQDGSRQSIEEEDDEARGWSRDRHMRHDGKEDVRKSRRKERKKDRLRKQEDDVREGGG